MRTVRPVMLRDVYAFPGPQIARLVDRGVLRRLADGYYVIAPDTHSDLPWAPTMEAAAGGIATAIYGDRVPVLMSYTAARIHHALPRAVATGIVAVPSQHRPITLDNPPGVVRFVTRDVNPLDAHVTTTELGHMLVTSVEQTALDIAHRPNLGGLEHEARPVAHALWPRCDQAVLTRLAEQQRRRATLTRLRQWSDA